VIMPSGTFAVELTGTPAMLLEFVWVRTLRFRPPVHDAKHVVADAVRNLVSDRRELLPQRPNHFEIVRVG